jgi:hypothetical protein
LAPDSPEETAEDLRDLARATGETTEIKAEETPEWDAANKIECAARALRQIRDGVADPRATASVALMNLGDYPEPSVTPRK